MDGALLGGLLAGSTRAATWARSERKPQAPAATVLGHLGFPGLLRGGAVTDWNGTDPQ